MRLSRSAYEAFLLSYKENIIQGKAPDLWLLPYYAGTDTEVRYLDGALISDFKCKLPKASFKNSKLGSLHKVKVLGKLVDYEGQQHFIAHGFKASPNPKMSVPLQLQLLNSAKFLTSLKLANVFSVVGARLDGTAKYLALPQTKADVTEHYKTRVAQLNQVLTGHKKWYWSDDLGSKARLLPIPEVLGLTVAYVPTKEHL